MFAEESLDSATTPESGEGDTPEETTGETAQQHDHGPTDRPSPDQPIKPKPQATARHYILLAIFMALWFLGLVTVLGAAGAYQGLQDRERLALAASADHKQKAKAYIQQGNSLLAIAELEEAHRGNPNDPEIAQLLAALTVKQAVEPTPTLGVVSQVDILGPTLAEGRRLYEAKDYEDAVTMLEGLHRIEPDYRRSEVEELLVNTYLGLARQYLAEERWEEAVQTFDKALSVQPNASVERERNLTSYYGSGLNAWGADWQRSVELFAAIVKIDPKYRDAIARLYEARVAYGDYLMERESPCEAQTQYAAALSMAPSAAVQSKKADASAACVAALAAAATAQAAKFTAQVSCCQPIGDDSASIRGHVRDAAKQPMAGVQLTIANSARTFEAFATSGADGGYAFDGLAPGAYTARITSDPASISAVVTVGKKQQAQIEFSAN